MDVKATSAVKTSIGLEDYSTYFSIFIARPTLVIILLHISCLIVNLLFDTIIYLFIYQTIGKKERKNGHLSTQSFIHLLLVQLFIYL